MQKVVLVSRIAAGLDTDRYVFIFGDHRAVRFYGSRYTDKQAKNIFLAELKEQVSAGKYPDIKIPGIAGV